MNNNKPKISRPFDMLIALVGSPVIVKLKDFSDITGILLAFDMYLNVVLDYADELIERYDSSTKQIAVQKKNIGLVFIKGDNVVNVQVGNEGE